MLGWIKVIVKVIVKKGLVLNFLVVVNVNIIGKKVNKLFVIEKRIRYMFEVLVN